MWLDGHFPGSDQMLSHTFSYLQEIMMTMYLTHGSGLDSGFSVSFPSSFFKMYIQLTCTDYVLILTFVFCSDWDKPYIIFPLALVIRGCPRPNQSYCSTIINLWLMQIGINKRVTGKDRLKRHYQNNSIEDSW